MNIEKINTLSSDFSVEGTRFAIVAARFNSFIVDQLMQGAQETLLRHGARTADIDVIRVPGAFEIPLAAQWAAGSGKYQAIIALGCVIRGETPHFEYIAGECARGIAAVALKFDLPVAFGVLTVDTVEQARERAGTRAGNKGGEAALSVLEMVNLLRQFR